MHKIYSLIITSINDKLLSISHFAIKMSCLILNGKVCANSVKDKLKERCSKLSQCTLAVILIGNNPASKCYVRNKEISCHEVGITPINYYLQEIISQLEVLELIDNLNNNRNIDGILVQLPLPSHLNTEEIILSIDPSKDVDGLHPLNLGQLMIGSPKFMPCTPAGILMLLEYYNISLSGKSVVICGRSNIVGKPLVNLLSNRGIDATVTLCHTKTINLEQYTKNADVVIAAVGQPKMITSNMIKSGAILIDVGINRIDNKIIGDIDFEDCKNIASAITPVPGGIGPMTIAMLLSNTVLSSERRKVDE